MESNLERFIYYGILCTEVAIEQKKGIFRSKQGDFVSNNTFTDGIVMEVWLQRIVGDSTYIQSRNFRGLSCATVTTKFATKR
jgi:hypothetical protein